MIATHDHLVKVDVGCHDQMLKYFGDLVLAMLRGAFKNSKISELGIAIKGYVRSEGHLARSVLLPFMVTSAHTDHITCVRFEYSLLPVAEVLGDKWCDLLVTGPMSRPVCHLRLELTPAECGLLLSRVHNAEQLEELSLEIHKRRDESPVDVQALEGALSNCRLRKLRIDVYYVLVVSTQWTTLLGAVLRGIAANHNDVEFVLQGGGLDGEDLSQLHHQCLERFKLVKKQSQTLLILKPHTPTGSVQRSLTSKESTSEVEASPVPVSTVRKKRSPPSPSRVLRSHVSPQLPSTSPSSPSPPTTSRAKRSQLSSVPKKPVKSRAKALPSTSQQLQVGKKRSPPSPSSRVLRSHMSPQLPSTSSSPPSSPTTSRAKRSRLSSVPKKPVKSRAKALPSSSQQLQASQELSSVEGVIKDLPEKKVKN